MSQPLSLTAAPALHAAHMAASEVLARPVGQPAARPAMKSGGDWLAVVVGVGALCAGLLLLALSVADVNAVSTAWPVHAAASATALPFNGVQMSSVRLADETQTEPAPTF